MKAIIKRLLSPLLKTASKVYLKKRRKYCYKGISVWVEPGVFPPFLTISTKLLLQFLETLDLKNKTFLELGCGCGILSIFAAKHGASVTASDINPTALQALNLARTHNGVNIETLHSDLFEHLPNRSFDCILINPPYYPKEPTNIAEAAWFCGAHFEYFERLFDQLPVYISASNKIYMILSDDCELQKIKAIARENGMAFKLVYEKKVLTENNYIFQVVLL